MKFALKTKTRNSSTNDQNSTITTLPTLKDICIECTAKDSSGRIVNFKQKCHSDSLYLKNYISGFTKASYEQNRTVNCIWK